MDSPLKLLQWAPVSFGQPIVVQPTPTPVHVAESVPNETEEDDDQDRYCHLCDEVIPLVDTAVQVEVVTGFKDGELFQCFAALDDDGDYRYTPLHFHERCWDGLVENVRMMNQDEPPRITRDESIRCSICDSSITDGEEFASAEPGEIHISPRSPDDKVEFDFFKFGEPKPVCFGCMAIVDQLVESYEEEDE